MRLHHELLLSDLAHGLLTPLRNFESVVSILERSNDWHDFNSLRSKYIPLLKIQADNLLTIASRLQYLELEEKASHLDIRDLIDNSLLQAQLHIQMIGPQVIQEIDHHAHIFVPKNAFTTAVSNIIINACEHNYAARNKEIPTITIQTQECKESRKIILNIHNTHSYIPEKDRDLIFKIGSSTKKNKYCGLGLTIAKNIVEESLGSLYVFSDVKYGTTFRITVPRSQQTF